MNNIKTICSNRRATFDYKFQSEYEMGLCLTGKQVKYIRNHSTKPNYSENYTPIQTQNQNL